MPRNEKGKNVISLTLKDIGMQSGSKERAARAVRPRIMTKFISVAAIIGLFGGGAAAMFGSILTGASWFAVNDGLRRSLSMTGSILLFMTIPLIALGACCLDWLEKDGPQCGRKAVRSEDDEEEQ
jgi:hypothetical protein